MYDEVEEEMQDSSGDIFGLIIVIIILVVMGNFLYKRFIKYPYRYVGYFYPSIYNLNKWVESEPFDSVEECRDWADGMADHYGVAVTADYDYECGKDCRKGDEYNQGVKYDCYSSVD